MPPPSAAGPRPRPTIRDVAAAADVSTATVSRVVNGLAGVDPKLEARVGAAVTRLGYRPSNAARRLSAGHTGLVGVLVPDLRNPFFHSVLKGATNAAARDGYSVVVADAGESPDNEISLAFGLLDQTDALMLCSPRLSDDRLRTLATDARPTVVLNHSPGVLPFPCVNVNEYEGALSLAGHLRELGHREVAYLRGPDGSWSSGERWRALQDAAAFGVVATALPCGSDLDAGFAAAAAVLGSKATAVVAFNDYVGLGLCAGLREIGAAVPTDVSVAGFDDIPFARFATPPLTTVRRPVQELGARAWAQLFAAIRQEAAADTSLLRNEIVVRRSTAVPSSRP